MKKTNACNTPADPTLPTVAITLKGREYTLAFDFNVLIKGGELLGENLLDGLDFDQIDPRRLRTLLYLALLVFQPEMTEEEAGALGGPSSAGKILKAIAQAYTGANPEAEPEDGKFPNAGTPESVS